MSTRDITTERREPSVALVAGATKRGATGRSLIRIVLLAGITLVFAYPLVWMILGSFKTQENFFADIWGLPEVWNFDNYLQAWTIGNIGQFLMNSVVVSLGSVALVLVLALPLAFALARLRFRGSNVIFGGFLITLFLPLQLTIIPLYELEARLGIINTYAGLILPYAAGALPFAVVFATAFFRGLPRELDEAALLDGASSGQTFLLIAVPLSRPAIATVVILTFLNVWNELLLALTLAQSNSVRTMPVGLLNFSQAYGATNYPQLFAALTIATIPVFVVFVVLQRQFISGLVDGAVK